MRRDWAAAPGREPVGAPVQRTEPGASIAAVLAATGLAPACLELELTESLFMHDVAQAVSQLHDMKALGVRCRSTISAPAIPAAYLRTSPSTC
jgi:hypothetical protein